ncbi:MAG: NAD-dependent epimerase/dehydratase family protein [Caldilineaceae bacterium]
MRVLITGGAGFIGVHLANELHRLGHYVRVLDDLSAGDPERLQPGITFSRGDVRDVPKLWSLLQGVDVVYHLAARVSVPASLLYPREYNDVNVGGTVALLEACRDVGIRRMVLTSSAPIYGNQTTEVVNEEMPPRPAVPYAVSKLAAELYMFNIGMHSGFETVALRIFNAYGPGQPLPPSHAPVIPQFMQQVLGRGSVVVFGEGQQIRDFVYVDDVVRALVSAADAPHVDRQIINVGSGQGATINELIGVIEQVTGRSANVLHNTERPSGLSRLVADLEKAGRLLDYAPQTELFTGLQRLMEEDPIFQHLRPNPGA